MIWLLLPWLPISALLLLLVVVAIREMVLSRSFLRGDPERGMAVFNICVLLVAIIAVSFGVRFLHAHEQVIEARIPIYTHARYAPERELFRDGDFSNTWIYVSDDEADAIVDYYNSLAQAGTIKIIIDSSKKRSPKLLLELGNKKNIFLTIEKEENRSVLYYSEEGEVRTVSSVGGVLR